LTVNPTDFLFWAQDYRVFVEFCRWVGVYTLFVEEEASEEIVVVFDLYLVDVLLEIDSDPLAGRFILSPILFRVLPVLHANFDGTYRVMYQILTVEMEVFDGIWLDQARIVFDIRSCGVFERGGLLALMVA